LLAGHQNQNQRRPLCALGLLIIGVVGCAHASPVGCGSDNDCKLARVCEAGQCIWPKQPAAVSCVAPPATTGAATIPVGPPAQAMFRFEPQHRGRSPYRLPAQKPEIRWTFETAGPITSSPALSSDGLVFVGSHDGRLHAIDRQGKLRWSFATGDLIFSSPALSASGAIYVGSDDDFLYALDGKNGKSLWKLRAGNCAQTLGVGPDASRCDVDGGPTIGLDGTIYFGGDAVYAVNPNGDLRWRFATGGHVSTAPAVMPDGTVIAGSMDNNLYAINKDGTKRWDFRARGDVESSPAIEEDGTIYFGSDDNKLYAISPLGQIVWAFSTGDDIRAAPAIGRDGTVYVGSFDGLFYAVHRDGTPAWTFRTGDRILSSALVDAAGAILFGSQDDRLYCLEPDGKLRWSVELGGDVDSSPILAADGTIYVGTDDKKLYALHAP
jgi:outer membrane protein assembly factor BamB